MTNVDTLLIEEIKNVIDTEINPALASHGGSVSLVEIQDDHTVLLSLSGGCRGCRMAHITMKQGIESVLKERFPQIKAVQDVTDHGF